MSLLISYHDTYSISLLLPKMKLATGAMLPLSLVAGEVFHKLMVGRSGQTHENSGAELNRNVKGL